MDLKSSSSKFKEDILKSLGGITQEILESMGDDFGKKKMSPKIARCLVEIRQWFYNFSPKEKKQLGDQLAQTNFVHICANYWKLLAENGKNTPIDGFEADCLATVRIICLNYSDASEEFAISIGKGGLFSILVADLHTFLNELDDEKVLKYIIGRDLAILHNCSKVHDNKKYLKDENTIKIIHSYAKVEDKKLKMRAIFTLARIIEEKNSEKILADASIITFILQYLKEAIENKPHRANGFSAFEMVSGIKHLVISDENKVQIVECGVLGFLVKLLEIGDDSEKAICTETIWILAFAEKNKKKIREEKGLMNILNKLAKSEGEAGKNAAGASWILLEETQRFQQYNYYVNIDNSNINSLHVSKRGKGNESFDSPIVDTSGDMIKDATNTREVTSVSAKQETCEHVMISYSWSYKKLILKIKNELEKRNYKVWIDDEQMKGSLLEAMAEAVDNSAVVLVCSSEKYKESKNCRTEASYAYERKKPIVHVKVEPGYKPDGWLGALLGEKLYYDFSEEKIFSTQFEKLVRELGNRGKLQNPNIQTDPPQPESVQTKEWPLTEFYRTMNDCGCFLITLLIVIVAILLALYL